MTTLIGVEDGLNCGSDSIGGSNSVVESRPSKPLVAGSNPVSRSLFCEVGNYARIRGQAVENGP